MIRFTFTLLFLCSQYSWTQETRLDKKWLNAEQVLSHTTPFFSNIRNVVSLVSNKASHHGSLDKKYQPQEQQIFRLISAYLPKNLVTVYQLESNLSELKAKIIDNQEYIQIFIHPSQINHFQDLLLQAKEINYSSGPLATPSSSARSLFILDENKKVKSLYKLSMAQAMGGINSRVITDHHAQRAIALSFEYRRMYQETQGKIKNSQIEWSYFPEKVALIPKNNLGGGAILRSLPVNTSTKSHFYIPLFALVSQRENEISYIEQLYNNSHLQSKLEFAEKYLIRPLTEMYSTLMFENGLTSELHQQNVLLAINEQNFEITKILIRDMDAHYIDFETRLLLNVEENKFLPQDIDQQIKIYHANASSQYAIKSYAEYLRYHSFKSILKYFLNAKELDQALQIADSIVVENYNKLIAKTGFTQFQIKHINEFETNWLKFKNEITDSKIKELYKNANIKFQAKSELSTYDEWIKNTLRYKEKPSQTPNLCSFYLRSFIK